eukprot:8735176-Lingulodinium_polyedra.AAC.1
MRRMLRWPLCRCGQLAELMQAAQSPGQVVQHHNPLVLGMEAARLLSNKRDEATAFVGLGL